MASINLGRVGFVLRGTWSATESYQPLDVVYYSGASYAARIANSGIAPNNSSAWQEMTADMAASVAQAAWSATQAAGSASSAAGSAAAAAGSANDAANSAKASAQSAREAEAVAHLTIDRTPRAGSANPVSSGGVYNALATKQGTLTFDNAPTAGSDNPVKSGGIKEALDGKKNTQTAVSSPSASGNALAFIDTISQNEQGVIAATKKAVTVDATPTANSTNPVQSGGVKAALDRKQGTLTFDNAPTANSDNPVKSRGIKEALDGKKNTQTAISSPSASGNALAFIDTISQDAQGVITATKKSVTVDTTPTANSTNPVQSGGVKTALEGKQSTLTFDSAPTANSDNPVKSSGIKAALDGKQNTLTLPLPVSQGGTGSNSLWRFLGHNTNFVYTSSNGTPNANDITYEEHIFAINIPNTPGYGFLDVSYNDGAGFTPSNAKPIIRQIWTNYDNPRDVRVRIKMGDSAWTSWVRFGTIPITANLGTITGTGSTVTVTKAVTGVTSSMTVDRIEFGTPSAVQSGWTVTTAANSVTFSATISGSTTVKIKLSDNTDVTGT